MLLGGVLTDLLGWRWILFINVPIALVAAVLAHRLIAESRNPERASEFDLRGALSATVTAETDRGRRPFRPGPDWPARLGELAYGVYLLADQTGVDVSAAVIATAESVSAHATRASRAISPLLPSSVLSPVRSSCSRAT